MAGKTMMRSLVILRQKVWGIRLCKEGTLHSPGGIIGAPLSALESYDPPS